MYHPAIIAARETSLLEMPGMREMYPDGIPSYSLDDARALTAQIKATRDPDSGQVIRGLTKEESDFAAASRVRVTYDAPFYLETFVWIDEEGHGLRSLYPLWESQQFALDRLAALELQAAKSGSLDGLLLNILKARQLGISTIAEALVSHRIFTQPFIRAIAGSDTEEQAKYLFRMVERIYANLPFFLRPERAVPYSAGRELHLDTKSSLKTAWGKTTRGALQAEGGKKGNIERGRSQPLDEPVLTPTGWVLMGDLRVGHAVIGRNGRPTSVVGVFPQGVESVYRVTFNDGSWTRCSGDHLWSVTTAARRCTGQAPFVRTTADLLAGGLFWDKPSGRMAKWFVPVVAPVEYDPVDLPIPPYTLGAYLGDGSTRTGALQFSCRDPEIKARVASELPPDLVVGAKEYNHCWYLRRANRRATRSPHAYLAALADLGLRGKGSTEKFIPTTYRMAPVADRIALLQGLMDTDGTASRAEGKINFSTVSPTLAAHVQELVESLGGIARCSMRPPKKSHVRSNGQRITGRHPYYVFSICLPEGIVPFHLSRKVGQLVPTEQRKYFPTRTIVAIDQEGSVPTQCIRVAAPDQLYVTRRFVVTHNTNSVVHISELATWDNPEQLDGALLPGIPINPKSLVLFESTAELAGDWWHRHWIASQEGEGRFRNLFIPWCVEPSKYSSPAPDNWQPTSDTLAVATQIERDSEPWVGRPLRLTRDQLYWYETTRAYYTKKNQLDQFYREYPSNPEECFQYAGKSVFTPSDLQRIDQAARPILDVWAVEPSRDIAELRRLTPEKAEKIEQAVKSLALQQDQRPPAPLSVRMAPKQAALYPVPPGYGFRRLGKEELRDLPSLRHSVLTIFEYPRSRGSRRYVMSVDVGDGLGLDYSVVTIVRLPTIEEPAEDVAQYVSNTVKPSQLAFICDAIGRFYLDEDGTEALAAIELNNHGATVQDLLQLHLGYSHFYIWEVVDAASPEARYTKRIGWQTTVRTRPLLLEKFHDAVTSIDPLSGVADFRLNSAITRQEMHFFVTEGLLGEAEHAKGQHDDAIFSSAIGYYVAHRLAGGEAEPIAERRRRRQQLQAQTQRTGVTLDYRNTAISADAAKEGYDDDADEDFGDDGQGIRHFDDRARD